MAKTESELRKPKLRPYFNIIPMDGERVQLRSARKVMLLRGKLASTLLPELLPYLDGTYTVDEIVAHLSDFPESAVRRALHLLTQRGLLEEGSIAPPDDFTSEELLRFEQQMRFFWELEGDRYASQRRLKESHVAVWASEALCELLTSALAGSGVGKVTLVGPESLPDLDTDAVEHATRAIRSAEDALAAITGADLAIVATTGPSPTLLSRFNDAALQTHVPLLPAQLDGVESTVGPTIYPHQTACFMCYELRNRANMPFHEEYLAYEEYLDRTPHQRQVGALLPTCGLIAHTAAWEAIRALTEFTLPGLTGSIMTINNFTLETRIEKVLKLPRCPVCSQVGPAQRIWHREDGK